MFALKTKEGIEIINAKGQKITFLPEADDIITKQSGTYAVLIKGKLGYCKFIWLSETDAAVPRLDSTLRIVESYK